MSLIETISADRISAMKTKDTFRLGALRNIWSQLQNEKIEKQRELTDEEIVTVLKRQVKQLADAAEEFVSGNRPELAEQNTQEIAIIGAYLPAQMDDAAIEAIVQEEKQTLLAAGALDMGRLMGAVMKRVGGNADGSRVRAFVETALKA